MAMDDLIEYCFMTALRKIKEKELPILISSFFSKFVIPANPCSDINVDVKKSKWKKVSKFMSLIDSFETALDLLGPYERFFSNKHSASHLL